MTETRAQKRDREARQAAAAAAAAAPAAVVIPAPVPVHPAPAPAHPVPAPPVPAISAGNHKRKRNQGSPDALSEEGEAETQQQAAGEANVLEQVVEVANVEEPGRKRNRSGRGDGNLPNADGVPYGSERAGDGLLQDEQESEGQGEQLPDQPMGPLNLLQLLGSRHATIQEEILRNLGPFEIIALSRTHKDFHDMRSALRNTNYNINARLGHLFDDTVAFRMLLARWQGIISGSFVEEFLNRSGLVPTNLDLRLPPHSHAQTYALLLGEGYNLREDSEDEDGDFEDPWDFVYSKHHAKYGELRVNVRQTKPPPILDLLEGATTTFDCMFITHEKAYMLFPDLTYKRKQAYVLLTTKYFEGRENYAKHGCRVINTSLVESVEAEMALPRRIGDAKTWTLPLDMQGLEDIPEYSPLTNVEHMTFRLAVADPSSDPRHYTMAVRSVSQCVLRNPFVIMDWDEDFGQNRQATERFNDRVDVHPIRRYLEKQDQMKRKLQDYSMIALKKIEEAERPVDDVEKVAEEFFGSQAKIPTHWPTYDDEVHEALDEAWKEMQDLLKTRK
ncbi:uncharacterized protein N0V89_007250 [Didymosphaeria variabile]|uniref:Uncharacterized protein n=1 Tax=Didymosphaeria variabile TaxID=1932322 RepID=A0A9W8XKI2_9PLEO|nr:uncharacterized protein N0V89_007250 [Didymosphaeria variabile]KAJ4351906.1 hypothetical protein N0V89_007250 [Didymosphaeria variabile]